MKRKIRFKVISSDGGHFGYYKLDLARQACNTELPLFDVRLGRCVRFCDVGYWPDPKGRCSCTETSPVGFLLLAKFQWHLHPHWEYHDMPA